MGTIVLDTNAYSAYMRGDGRVLDQLAKAAIVYMPLFVVGELNYGFRGGRHFRRNQKELGSFLSKPTVQFWLPTVETAYLFGEIKDRLKRKGKPIPINDIWIACASIESGSILISFDAHFKYIDGINLWSD